MRQLVYTFDRCQDYLEDVAACARRVNLREVHQLRESVSAAADRGSMIFAVGNGGGGTVMEHFTLGLSLNVLREGGSPMRAITLSSGIALSSAANDFHPENMFAAQLAALARRDDLLVAFSGSGCSENIVRALQEAHNIGVKTASLVGQPGRVSELSDVWVDLKSSHNATAEDVAIMLLHWVYCSFMSAR